MSRKRKPWIKRPVTGDNEIIIITQSIKNRLKSSTENENLEELKRKPMPGHQQIDKNPWHCVAQV
jgi:hypothetical protein